MCWQRALTLGNTLAAARMAVERSPYLQGAGGYNAGVANKNSRGKSTNERSIAETGGMGGEAHKDPDETVLTKVAGTVMTPCHPFDTQSAALSGPCALL